VTQNPGAGPDFSPPGFRPCYRHSDRMTGINCQRCKRPICGECMNPASVGFQCPKCASPKTSGVREPKTSFGAALTARGGTTTKVLMGVLAGVWVIDLVTRGLATGLLVMSNQAVAAGQFWRLLTGAVVSGSIFGVLVNMLILWMVGRALESELGGWRFVALYFAAGLGGSTLLFVLGPFASGGYGASAAVLGLLAANAIFKYKAKEDVRPDIGLFALLVLYGVLVNYANFGWLMLIGGIVAGAAAGAVLAYAPRQNRATIQVVGLLGVLLVCLLAVVAKLTLL